MKETSLVGRDTEQRYRGRLLCVILLAIQLAQVESRCSRSQLWLRGVTLLQWPGHRESTGCGGTDTRKKRTIAKSFVY